MANWPDLAMVKQQLGATTSEADTVIAQGLAAAIEQVKIDVSGTVTEFEDEDYTTGPTSSLAQAALILAVMAVKAPDAPYGVAAVFDTGGLRVAAQHPTYRRMLVGQRYSFSIG